MTGTRRAIFLDRDGVLNVPVYRGGKPFVPTRVSDLLLYEDSAAALAAAKRLGFLCIVVTNQPDVAKGDLRREDLDAIHAHLRRALPDIDDLLVCTHVDADACRCRKPLPGMLEEADRRWGIDLARSYLVGDRWRDIGAGRAAGCRTILRVQPHSGEVAADHAVGSLSEAVRLIHALEAAGK